MSFYREQQIAKTRKDHRCGGCGRKIEVGSNALYLAGMNSAYDGVWYDHYHHDCRAAEVALNDLVGWRDGDEWLRLDEAEPDEWAWLSENHPTVFARMRPAEAA